jgi:retron-type reverse transcriptase
MSQPEILRVHRPRTGTVMEDCADIEKIISSTNLTNAFQHLKRYGGQGRDIFGSTYPDYCGFELGRELHQLIRTGAYQPQACRSVHIPKRGSTPATGQAQSRSNTRELLLPFIPDRVVSYALHSALTPIFDRDFHPRSFGFRRGKSVCHLLAQLRLDLLQSGHRILAQDDIQNAFPSADFTRILDLINTYPFRQELLDLIERVLRGERASDFRGIRQGDSFSPTALNILLNHVLDRWHPTQRPNLSWHRYADNLAYLCQDLSEGTQILNATEERLQFVGLKLKHVNGRLTDLSRNAVQFLGFSLRWKQNDLCINLAEETWTEIENSLDEHAGQTQKNAQSVLKGMINTYGPAFWRLRSDKPVRRLWNMYSERFDPVNLAEIRNWIDTAGLRWKSLRDNYQSVRIGEESLLPNVAAPQHRSPARRGRLTACADNPDV